MSLYEKVLKEIEQKKINKEQGYFNGIPFPYQNYQENYVSSIDKGQYAGIVAAPGEGKSRWARYTYVYKPLQFSLKHNYPIKILYFALEDSKESIQKKIFAHYLYDKHNEDVNPKYLESKEKPLSQRLLDLIKKDAEFYKKFEDNVFIIDNINTPSGIYNKCVAANEKFGATHHMIVIIDNYANIIKEAHHLNEHEAVGELSRKYVRLELCKRLKMSVLAVVQQDLASVNHAARNSDNIKMSTVEPNLASLGNNKQITRDFHILWALFTPWRFEIKAYPNKEGWNTEVLRNRFKSLIMLKTNESEMAPRMGMLFNGGRETFEEMPSIKDIEALDRLYKNVLQEEQEKRDKFKKTLF